MLSITRESDKIKAEGTFKNDKIWIRLKY